jgi:hypothetical protein
MELQENSMRTQISKDELTNNYNKVIDRIWNVCDHNDYVIKVDGINELSDGTDPLYGPKPNFDELSQNARKNVAKRLNNVNAKDSRKAMNVLFLVLRKLGVISENVKIDISYKEKAISRLRITYKHMKSKAEEARLAYNKEKGDFYK